MTLQSLPPADVTSFEFDSDIKDGIRPTFLDEVSIIRTYSSTENARNKILGLQAN